MSQPLKEPPIQFLLQSRARLKHVKGGDTPDLRLTMAQMLTTFRSQTLLNDVEEHLFVAGKQLDDDNTAANAIVEFSHRRAPFREFASSGKTKLPKSKFAVNREENQVPQLLPEIDQAVLDKYRKCVRFVGPIDDGLDDDRFKRELSERKPIKDAVFKPPPRVPPPAASQPALQWRQADMQPKRKYKSFKSPMLSNELPPPQPKPAQRLTLRTLQPPQPKQPQSSQSSQSQRLTLRTPVVTRAPPPPPRPASPPEKRVRISSSESNYSYRRKWGSDDPETRKEDDAAEEIPGFVKASSIGKPANKSKGEFCTFCVHN